MIWERGDQNELVTAALIGLQRTVGFDRFKFEGAIDPELIEEVLSQQPMEDIALVINDEGNTGEFDYEYNEMLFFRSDYANINDYIYKVTADFEKHEHPTIVLGCACHRI